MKPLFGVFIAIIMLSCSERHEDQGFMKIVRLNGNWRWEATCGGFSSGCGYPSETFYQEIDLNSDGQYIHKTNDKIDLRADFTLKQTDENSLTLVLSIDTVIYPAYISKRLELPIFVVDNSLTILHGDMYDSYVRIK